MVVYFFCDQKNKHMIFPENFCPLRWARHGREDFGEDCAWGIGAQAFILPLVRWAPTGTIGGQPNNWSQMTWALKGFFSTLWRYFALPNLGFPQPHYQWCLHVSNWSVHFGPCDDHRYCPSGRLLLHIHFRGQMTPMLPCLLPCSLIPSFRLQEHDRESKLGSCIPRSTILIIVLKIIILIRKVHLSHSHVHSCSISQSSARQLLALNFLSWKPASPGVGVSPGGPSTGVSPPQEQEKAKKVL